MALEVRYNFSQRFAVSAQNAYNWCTNFEPNDHMLMGEENAERQINKIAAGTLILKDTFNLLGAIVEKQKLVKLYPEELSWTSTHLTGPNKNSQFLYRITSQGKNASKMDFIAAHIEHNEKTDAEILANRFCKEDGAAWKLLAKAMEDEQKTPEATKKSSKNHFT